MRNPLYLYHRDDDQQIRMDGASLLVSHHGRAASRYPLARISRVVVEETVQFGLDLLVCFARWNIPLVIVDKAGHGRVLVQPLHAWQGDFAMDVERFVALPDSADRGKGWVYAREHWHMRKVAVELFDQVPGGISRTRLRSRVGGRSGNRRAYLALMRMWRGYLAVLVAERLGMQGLPGELLHVHPADWHPVHWLCDILAWDLDLHFLDVVRTHEFNMLRQLPSSSLAVRSFETRAPRLRKLADAEIRRLRCWLACQEVSP